MSETKKADRTAAVIGVQQLPGREVTPLDVLFDEEDTRETARQLLVEAWEVGWRAGYEAPDLPCEPGQHANASFMNPYRVEGIDA